MLEMSNLTDSCVSPACTAAFGATSSLSQGETFAKMTSAFHGGRRQRQRGGSASFPGAFEGSILPADMHAAADLTKIDAAYNQLPEFVGKYGMSGGRRTRRKQRGGVAPVDAPAMILSPAEEQQAFLNPQWYTENQVIPSFKGPGQSGGRKARKASRKSRKASRKSRKASRKSRKASRKSRKARKASRKSRKARKASRKPRKASRKSRKARKASRKSRKARKASRKSRQ